MSNDLEKLENLEMYGNLHVGPKSQGNVRDFEILQTAMNASIPAKLKCDVENWSGKVSK